MSFPLQKRLKNIESQRLALGAAAYVFSKARQAFRLLDLNVATAQSINLPKATGKGGWYEVFNSVTATGNKTIRVGVGLTDVIVGIANIQSSVFQSASGNNTLTLNGTTTGGVAGSVLWLRDAAPGIWLCEANLLGSGTAATPFSTT